MSASLKDLENALKKKNIEDIKKTLQNFGITATNDRSSYCLLFGLQNSSSPEIMKLVFEAITEAGGAGLLEEKLAAGSFGGRSWLKIGCDYAGSNPKVLKLLAVVLFAFGLFEEKYAQLHDMRDKATLLQSTNVAWRDIDSPSWIPDPENLAEVETLLYGVNVVALNNALQNSQQSLLKEMLGNNKLFAKKILNARVEIIRKLAQREPDLATPFETMMSLFFSEIRRIGGDQYLKQFLTKENSAGETCLFTVCFRYPERLEPILDAIEDIGGEQFIAEEISKERQSDGMTCFAALIRSADDQFGIFSLFVSKVFHCLGRRFLREQFQTNEYFEYMFNRSFVSSEDERKWMSLMSGLYSMTGMFEELYLRLNEKKREKLRRICNIYTSDWSRARATDSTMPNVIGEIKRSSKSQNNNNNNNKSSDEKADTAVTRNIRTMEGLNYNDPAVLRALFNEFDYNGDGVLSCGEILPMMMHLFKDASPAEIELKVKAADTNSDGMLSFDEFSQLVKTTKKVTDEDLDLDLELTDEDLDLDLDLELTDKDLDVDDLL